MYDWSLEPTAALYYSQDGLEPLHAQFDYLKNTVSVYNDLRRAFKGYHVYASVYDIHSKKVLEKDLVIDIPSDGLVKDAIKLDFPADLSQVHFIKLVLKDQNGKVVSDSFYWRSKDKYEGAWTMTGPAVSGFQELNNLKKVELAVTAVPQKGKIVKLKIHNPAESIAFFTQIKLQDELGKNLKPAFYSDNFFNLLPGETKIIDIDYAAVSNIKGKLKVVTAAFNSVKENLTVL